MTIQSMKSLLAQKKNANAITKKAMKMARWDEQTAKNAKAMEGLLGMQTKPESQGYGRFKRNANADKTKFIYDLNIYQLEQVDADGEYRFFGPWYIHVYEYTGQTTEEVTVPIQLTPEEQEFLINNDPYFDNEVDTWYGLDGFIFEKWEVMSDRLRFIFEMLPKYKEEVLF